MILPIHLLDTGDELEFGKEYVLLSKLHRLGFPAASGFVISPPFQEIKHYIIDHDIVSLRDFETKRGSLLTYLLEYQPEMHSLDASERQYLLSNWLDIVGRWISELHSHYVRFETFTPKHFHLKSHPILITDKIIARGSAVWNPLDKQVNITLAEGELDHAYLAYIDQMVQKADKKLGIKYSYQFIVNSEGLKFIRLEDIKHQLLVKETRSLINQVVKKTKSSRKIKLFTTFSGHLTLDEFCDGYLLESELFKSHDEKQLVLLETMMAKHPQVILYQVALRFIKSDAAAIKLCRNLKKQDNLELVLRADAGKDDLLQIKRDLAAEGVSRKGKLKFWIRVALPGIALQLGELTQVGFDGVIFDIDFIAAALHGRDITDQGQIADIKGLLQFLEPLIKKLTKEKVPVIFYGSLVAAEEVVQSAIKWQVFGLVTAMETEKVAAQVSYQEQVLHFGLS